MSLTANVLSGTFKLIHAKELIMWVAKNPPRSSVGFLPKGLKNDKAFGVHSQLVNGKEVVTITKAGASGQKAHLFFLHGGAYIMEALPTHWTMIKNIINQSDCRITFLDYPLAPEHTFQATFDMVSKVYDLIAQQYAGDEFVLMGDSAGGGLAFAFNQKLIEEKHSVLPVKTILLSPWLDLSLSHPDIDEMEEKDVMLSLKLLSFCAERYAGGTDQREYLLSPINGTIDDCPKTLVVYSTHELFYPDCEKLKAKAEKLQQENFTFKSYKGLPHDWGILPIPEAGNIVNDICEFIKD